MVAELPLHRFRAFGEASAAEIAAIRALGEPPRQVGKQQVIRREGENATSYYQLIDGWVASSITLPDGSRQILKVHFPGDSIGTPSMCLDRAAETLSAITPAVVSAVPIARLGALFLDHPRLAARFLLAAQRERVALMDAMTSIGRSSADQRVAAMLLDFIERLEPLGVVADDSFDLHTTQEQIGDLLGLTGVHVNRTLRELERSQLIARDRQRVTILDRPGLVRLAARPNRTLRRDLGWLPPATDPAPDARG